MPPIRRYLRISKYSVLECRIFLENPADGPRWLLNPTDPALPRVFAAVRHLVLPKLREENERAKGKGKKKKIVKDVVVEDDFEASVFLTDVDTKHNLVVKEKVFEDGGVAVKSNTRADPVILQEDSDDGDLSRIPQAADAASEEGGLMQDDKKMAFKTTYRGFSIHGKVLCLLVERKNEKKSLDGQALMQEWITASQMQLDDD